MRLLQQLRRFLDARAEFAAEQLLLADLPIIYQWKANVTSNVARRRRKSLRSPIPIRQVG